MSTVSRVSIEMTKIRSIIKTDVASIVSPLKIKAFFLCFLNYVLYLSLSAL